MFAFDFTIGKEMMRRGCTVGDVQKAANRAYKRLSAETLEVYQKRAEELNQVGGDQNENPSRVSKDRVVKKAISNIHQNVS